jgi:hypothetical protein
MSLTQVAPLAAYTRPHHSSIRPNYSLKHLSFIMFIFSGYGSLVPVTSAGKALTVLYALTSPPLFFCTIYKSAVLLKLGIALLHRCFFPSRAGAAGDAGEARRNGATDSIEIVADGGKRDDGEDSETQALDYNRRQAQDYNQIHRGQQNSDDCALLHFAITFAVLLVYIFAGAAMFIGADEDYWGYWNSVYFVFISMTTVGYGDLVPPRPLIFGGLVFIFFGMVLEVLCILLVVQAVSNRRERRQQQGRR